MTDPIRDAVERIRRIMEEHGMLSPKLESAIAAAEDETRQDWAGERPYIAKRGERTVLLLSERNRAIIRDWKAGERQALLARKYGISRQRVKQIIEG